MLKRLVAVLRQLFGIDPIDNYIDPLDSVRTPQIKIEVKMPEKPEDPAPVIDKACHPVPEFITEKKERVLTDSLIDMQVEGISLLNMEIIGEGRSKCPEHHWHKVTASREHLNRVAEIFKDKVKHEDFVCCKCTFGKCNTKIG